LNITLPADAGFIFSRGMKAASVTIVAIQFEEEIGDQQEGKRCESCFQIPPEKLPGSETNNEDDHYH
jgi:hypothetical protein